MRAMMGSEKPSYRSFVCSSDFAPRVLLFNDPCCTENALHGLDGLHASLRRDGGGA